MTDHSVRVLHHEFCLYAFGKCMYIAISVPYIGLNNINFIQIYDNSITITILEFQDLETR